MTCCRYMSDPMECQKKSGLSRLYVSFVRDASSAAVTGLCLHVHRYLKKCNNHIDCQIHLTADINFI